MSDSLLALLHRANQVAAEKFSSAFRRSEMTARQVQILAAIKASDEPSQSTLVNLTGVDRSTLANIMQRLEEGGLVKRRPYKGDKRAYATRLTNQGIDALEKGMTAIESVENSMMADLSEEERTQLIAILGKIVARS